MSKYGKLWEYISKCGESPLILTFEEIEEIAGLPIDHSFLRSKKELNDFGWEAQKISMKERIVRFGRIG